MQRRIGHVAIETIAAESAKFTAPLLFIHGLWATAAVWRKFMGFLAHRGWTSHAVHLRGRVEVDTPLALGRVRFADYLDDVRGVLAACDAAPVLIGHDLGALLALACAPSTRAVVGLAPLVPQGSVASANAALSSWRARIAIVRARPLPPPRGKSGLAYFGSELPGGAVPDSSAVARELVRGEIPLPAGSRVPTLLLGGASDRIVPPRAVEHLANQVGAGYRCVDAASHAMPWEPGWEQRVAEVHRWLIQTLGEELLLSREEDED